MDQLYTILLLGVTGLIALILDNKSCYYDENGIAYSVNYKKYLGFLCIVMYLIISLRSYSVGKDTLDYVKDFVSLDPDGPIIYYSRDHGFALFNWLLRHLTSNGRIYLLLVSWPLPLSFYLLLKDERKPCLFAYFGLIMLLILEIFAFSMAGVRQTFAIFFTALAYKVLKKRRYFLFVICVLCASVFHFSAIVFLIMLPCKFIKFRIYHIVVLIAVFILVKINPGQVFSWISDSLFGSVYEQYGTAYKSSASYAMLIIQLALFAILAVNRKMFMNSDNYLLINAVWIGIIMQACTPVIAEFFRVAFYFSIYYCLLIPRALYEMTDSNRRICMAGVWICAICYMLFFTNPLAGYSIL